MASFRCSPCDVTWPGHRDFEACPLCAGECWNAGDPEGTLTHAQAKALVLRAQASAANLKAFADWCWERTADHPEVIEARAILANLPTAGGLSDVPADSL